MSSDADAWKPTAIAAVFALGFVVLTWKVLAIQDGPTIVALLVLPLLVYGIASGRFAEFTAPGGWGGKFREAASAKVNPTQIPLDLSNEQMEAIPKESRGALLKRVGGIRDGRPIVLTLRVASGGPYQSHAIAYALQTLGEFRGFKFVVFLRPNDELVGYLPSWALRTAVERNLPEANELVEAVNSGNEITVQSYPGMITETVTSDSTNADALKLMESRNLEALVVVDAQSNKVLGVVERDRLLGKMLVALADA